jgi:hypothetical protein
MTNLWLARLISQFAVELEVLPFVSPASSHGIARKIIRAGMTDAITRVLGEPLENALLDEIHALPTNMPLEGVYAIASDMFLARGRLELSELDAGLVHLKLELEALERPHAARRSWRFLQRPPRAPEA